MPLRCAEPIGYRVALARIPRRIGEDHATSLRRAGRAYNANERNLAAMCGDEPELLPEPTPRDLRGVVRDRSRRVDAWGNVSLVTLAPRFLHHARSALGRRRRPGRRRTSRTASSSRPPGRCSSAAPEPPPLAALRSAEPVS